EIHPARPLPRGRNRWRGLGAGPIQNCDASFARARHDVRAGDDGGTGFPTVRDRARAHQGRSQQKLRGAASPDLCPKLRVPSHRTCCGDDRDLSGHGGGHRVAPDQDHRTTGALRMSARRQPWIEGLARHCVLIGTSATMVLPFVWMVSLSLKPPQEIFSNAWQLWPSTFYGIENYRTALSAVPPVGYLGDGVIVCAVRFMLRVHVD